MLKIYKDEENFYVVIEGVISSANPSRFTLNQTGDKFSVFDNALQKYQLQGLDYTIVADRDGNSFATSTLAFDYLEEVFTPFKRVSFETVSKNLKAWDASFGYTGNNLTTVTYTNGSMTIVKTLTYTSKQLTSIVLSGDTPNGINLTKTLTYTGKDLTSISYS